MKKKKILISAIVGILVLAGIFIGAGLYMLDFSLRPINRGKDIKGSMTYIRETYPQVVPWIDSLTQCNALRDTFITAPDGIRLHAFYAYSSKPTANTAVIIHGYTDNAIRMFHIGYLYNHSLDFNVLLPDLRYSGLSEGDAIQMGWLDRKDVMQWINVAPHLFGDSLRTVVHGISMGAATTMMLSGEELPTYIKCFVEDCGYTSVWDQFEKELVTNDIAEINGQNQFRILGRKDNTINTGGVKVQIEQVEAALKEHLSVPFLITSAPDEKFGEIIVLLAEGQLPDDIEQTCTHQLPPYWRPKRFVPVFKLPLTETGKPDRAIAKLLAQK